MNEIEMQKLQQAGINFEDGIKRFAGNEALFEKYLNRFQQDEHMQAAREAYEAGDYDAILKAVHAMKGVVGTLGMDALFTVCADVVAAIRGERLGEIEDLMKKLEAQYAITMKIYEE